MTQFHNDDTPITLFTGQPATAEIFIKNFFNTWDYSHRYLDVLAMVLCIGLLRFGTYLSLRFVNNKKN